MTQDEAHKRIMATLNGGSKPRRKPARQQAREARQQALTDAMTAMRDARRSVPSEWLRGFDAAMSAVGQLK